MALFNSAPTFAGGRGHDSKLMRATGKPVALVVRKVCVSLSRADSKSDARASLSKDGIRARHAHGVDSVHHLAPKSQAHLGQGQQARVRSQHLLDLVHGRV